MYEIDSVEELVFELFHSVSGFRFLPNSIIVLVVPFPFSEHGYYDRTGAKFSQFGTVKDRKLFYTLYYWGSVDHLFYEPFHNHIF